LVFAGEDGAALMRGPFVWGVTGFEAALLMVVSGWIQFSKSSGDEVVLSLR